MKVPNARTVGLWLVVLLVASQIIPVNRDNPPATGALVAPAPVMSILQRSCNDCHAHETIWPWYSRVAPISWLIAHDVHEGRRHVDFSDWSAYPPDMRQKKLLDIVDQVQKGDMPLWYTQPLHPASRLTQDDVNTVVGWAESASARLAR